MSAHACRNKNFLKLLCSIYTFLFYNRCIHETTNESIQLLHTQSENIGVFTPMLCIANWVLDNLKICVDATYSSSSSANKKNLFKSIFSVVCWYCVCVRVWNWMECDVSLKSIDMNGSISASIQLYISGWFVFGVIIIKIQFHLNLNSWYIFWNEVRIGFLHTREYIWWSVNNKMW